MKTDELCWRPFGRLLSEGLRNGLTRPKRVRGSGVKMVNMGELFSYPRIRNVSMERVPLSHEEAKRYLLRTGDLLFARQSLVYSGAGKCSIFLGAPEPVTFEGHLIRARLDPSIADPSFYFYFFNSTLGRKVIGQIIEQVAAAGIRASDLSKLEVPYPSLNKQRAIGALLAALDDKIELNRQMNDTLEAIARTIFKSWFVDFDPVWARANGEQSYGMDAETAALFPDAFVDSELGPIPEGWEVRPIGEIVTAVGGGTPSTKNPAYWDRGSHCFATPKDLSGSDSPILLDTARRVTDTGLAKISSGLLPLGTVLLSSRAPVGYLALTRVPACVNQGFIAMVCDGPVSSYYILNWTHANMTEIKGRASGTTFAEISKRSFRPIPALTPAPAILAAFDSVVDPLYDRIELNVRESLTLAELRDTLLPKLISGELRVPEAAQRVE